MTDKHTAQGLGIKTYKCDKKLQAQILGVRKKFQDPLLRFQHPIIRRKPYAQTDSFPCRKIMSSRVPIDKLPKIRHNLLFLRTLLRANFIFIHFAITLNQKYLTK